MAYYLKYNGVDLTDLVKVRSVEIPSLPSIEHSSKNVFERHGNIFNGVSYNNREIKLIFIVQPDDPEDYDVYINDIKRTFYVKEERRLFCGNRDLYIWCVPVGDVIITELGGTCAEVEVDLIAYDPYWYSIYQNVFTQYVLDDRRNHTMFIDNKSDTITYPIFSIGFSADTTFVQLENQNVGERLLIGQYPTTSAQPINRDNVALKDTMQTSTGWKSTGSVDGDRDTSGKFTMTSDNEGLTCKNFGSKGDSTWHGACCMKELKEPTKDFRCRFRIRHNSTGENGDPTDKQIVHPYKDDEEITYPGVTEYYYVVNASSGLALREEPEVIEDNEEKNTHSNKICTMPNGTIIEANENNVSATSFNYIIGQHGYNGWSRVSYTDAYLVERTGYCKSSYLKRYTRSTTETTVQKNFVTRKDTAIRTEATEFSTNKKTIPIGTCIRCYIQAEHEIENGKGSFYKMSKKYNGVSGYVLIEDLEPASDYYVEYEEEYETADDKTGIVEIYGYSKNNVQLFRLGMYDDNEYYEFTYPVIRKNNEDFLVDKTVAPAPKIKEEYDYDSKKISKTLSGKYGDWNEFYGELYIERINNRWFAYVNKINNGEVVKRIASNTVTDIVNSTEELHYIVIYIGTSGDAEKASGMSVTYCEVLSANAIDTDEPKNIVEFRNGDILTIDNSIPAVYLNGIEKNWLINIGSDFFGLEPGINTIKAASDTVLNVDVIWRNKYL